MENTIVCFVFPKSMVLDISDVVLKVLYFPFFWQKISVGLKVRDNKFIQVINLFKMENTIVCFVFPKSMVLDISDVVLKVLYFPFFWQKISVVLKVRDNKFIQVINLSRNKKIFLRLNKV